MRPSPNRVLANVFLPVATIGCLIASPLVAKNQPALLGVRVAGTLFGLATCLRKTDSELSWLEQEKQQLSQERDDISKRYIADTEILEEWVKDESKRLEETANERIKQAEDGFNLLLEDAFGEAEKYQQMYLETQQRLEVYLLPRKPSGTSRLEVVSGRVIDFLYSHGILADYEDCWTENEYDLIRIKPRSGGKEQFHKLSDELQLELQLGKQPTFNISQGCIQIRLETYGIDTKSVTSKPNIKEPSEGFLRDILDKFSSIRVNGETGSGKSTFVRHLLVIFNILFPDLETVLVDPKYPMSEWDISPQYKGIEEAYDGLVEAAEQVEKRLKLAREDKDAGRKIRSFKPVLYVIDEIDWIITHYGQDAANQLRTTLKVGRALNVRLLYLGQTPLATRLKMNRDDFRHSTSFFLGENVPAAIDETCLSSSLKTELENQFVLRQETDDRFQMLVKYPGKQPFLSKVPGMVGNTGNDRTVSDTGFGNEAEINNGCNGIFPVEESDIERKYDFEKNGNSRKLTEIEDKTVSQEFPGTFPDISQGSGDDMARNALISLSEGLSKSDIITNIWEYKGRRYQLGKDLWSELGLPE